MHREHGKSEFSPCGEASARGDATHDQAARGGSEARERPMSPNPDCEELEGALIAVADATASSDEAAAVRGHVAKCQDCARSLDELRALLRDVRAADPAPEQSERFWN